jgi:polar amino acid transport system substrate-binding protein
MSAVSAQAETALDRIKAAGVVRVGIANINPYGFVGPDGKVSGQSPELLRAFFGSMDVEVEPVVTEFGSLIGGLLAGHFDVVSTGMLIQPDRCDVVAFGNPEYRSDNAFAVSKGNPLRLTSYRTVAESANARLGMITGSGEIAYATRAGVPDDRQILFPDLTTAMAALQAGRVDAVVASTVTMRNAVTRAATDTVEYAALSEQPTSEDGKPATRYGAMAFRKEDDALRDTWNAWLAENLANGTVTKIICPLNLLGLRMT